jgi:hypothetical protein
MLGKTATYHERQIEQDTACVYIINMASRQESGVLFSDGTPELAVICIILKIQLSYPCTEE